LIGSWIFFKFQQARKVQNNAIIAIAAELGTNNFSNLSVRLEVANT